MAKLPCPPELWPAFSALLDQAMDVPDGERPGWLASLGAEHAAVRPWLARVITPAAATPEPHFLKAPAFSDSAAPEFRAGARIGPTCCKSASAAAAWARYGWPHAATDR